MNCSASDNKLSLKDCLVGWQKQQEATDVCSRESLADLLEDRLEDEERNRLFRHLVHCPACRRQLWHLQRFLAKPDILEVALPKAAADTSPELFVLETAGRRYQLIYRRLLEREDEGVLTVKVQEEYREEDENHLLIVVDAQGKEIMRGRVENGEVSRLIKGPAGFQWQTLLIRRDTD